MKVICVCGGREYANREYAFKVLDGARAFYGHVMIKNGAARGADKLSSEWALSRGVPLHEYPADWNTHKKAAGPIRNREMLQSGFDMLIAFPGGSGTADMVKITKKAGIEVLDLRNMNIG